MDTMDGVDSHRGDLQLGGCSSYLLLCVVHMWRLVFFSLSFFLSRILPEPTRIVRRIVAHCKGIQFYRWRRLVRDVTDQLMNCVSHQPLNARAVGRQQ